MDQLRLLNIVKHIMKFIMLKMVIGIFYGVMKK